MIVLILSYVSSIAGNSIDHMNNYSDRMEVHSTSGIFNKAWCLLKNTDGWDYKMAFKVSVMYTYYTAFGATT